MGGEDCFGPSHAPMSFMLTAIPLFVCSCCLPSKRLCVSLGPGVVGMVEVVSPADIRDTHYMFLSDSYHLVRIIASTLYKR